MTEAPNGQIALSGTTPSGILWTVRSYQYEQNEIMTLLSCYRDGKLQAEAGFGGPPLPDHKCANLWSGRWDDIDEQFVVARLALNVNGVFAQLTSGEETPLSLSESSAELGVRFAALAIPGDATIAGIYADVGDDHHRLLL